MHNTWASLTNSSLRSGRMSLLLRQCHFLPGEELLSDNLLMCRDVAICFHVHCLSPFRFMKDIKKDQPRLWEAGLSFPLERLHHMLEKSIWTDLTSQTIWDSEFPDWPYQLWKTNPVLTDEQAFIQEVDIPKSFSLDLVAASLRKENSQPVSFTNVRVSTLQPTFQKPSHDTTSSFV